MRGPGIRGLLAAGTSSGDMLLLDPASGYKVRGPQATRLWLGSGDAHATECFHQHLIQ